jgi:antitoxin component YwqK of YwqJK toxin-antitoxin module
MKHIIFLFLLISFPALQLNAQLFRKEKTSVDKTLKHHKHFEYWDDDSTTVATKGHYCNNIPCKTWKYYHSNGVLRLKVKYADRIKIKYFSTDRRLEQKGYAILDSDPGGVHFYWQGIWKYYNEKRKLYRVARFDKGEEAEVIFGPAKAIYFE